MKNYCLMAIVGGILLFLNPLSYAGIACLDNWYVGGSGSVVWHNDHKFSIRLLNGHAKTARHYKRGWGANGSIGYLIEGCRLNCRIEGEFLYRENNLKDVRLTVVEAQEKVKTNPSKGHNKDSAIMLNLFGDIFLCTDLKLYLGLGLGITYNQLSMSNWGEQVLELPHRRDSWLIARQFIGGFSYDCADWLTLTLGYRLFATGPVHTPRNLQRCNNTPYTHSMDLGIRFQL